MRPARFALLLTFAAALPALGQASLEIGLRNASNELPVAGAEVRLGNAAIGFTASGVTNAQGKVRFPSLSTAGEYMLTVPQSAEFEEAKVGGISLRTNFDRSVTLALAPRQPRREFTESIEVKESETNLATINTVNAEVSSTLQAPDLEVLPIEGRDITRVLYRLPNVTQATGFYPEAPNVSINGANSLYANYMLDGLDNNENFLGGEKFAVPVGFTQDITVLTATYSAEFGRTGNGIINVTTRSGGNGLTGDAFYLTRPGASVDASSPFAGRDLSGNAVKDGFERKQGGGSFGDAYDGNSDRYPGASRNSDRLPWSYVFDLGAQYRVPLGGGGRPLELRVDVFNLFNRTNLSGYSNNATQSNQIQIGPPGGPIVEKNSGPPRQLQFGVRYAF
ncbi:MAG: TonB-dependent receptor [Thermoanaerobaculia bacterium]